MKLELEDVNLRDVMRRVGESMFPVATAAGLQLQMSSLPSAMVRGDARRLEQVFLNLIGNAVKFTPEKGSVGVAVTTDGDSVEIRVSDTGPGIDPEFVPHMFEAFRQGDETSTRRYGGVGLGLSIAKELVEAHRGRIEAESAGVGRGATFIVTLPLSQQAAAVAGDDWKEKSPGQPHL
jgi:signal transduction histidine kinase